MGEPPVQRESQQLLARLRIGLLIAGVTLVCVIGLVLAQLQSSPRRAPLRTLTAGEIQEKLRKHDNWLKRGQCKPDANDIVDPEKQKPDARATTLDSEPASFFNASLRRQDFGGRDLRCASFVGADLEDATFSASDLRGALFTRASLSSAKFIHTDLRGTVFNWADMKSVVFEPLHQPMVQGIAYAKGLGWLTSTDTPTHLVALKKALGDAGYLEKRKDIIAALNRWEPPSDLYRPIATWLANATRSLRYVLFDLTCEYGSNAVRPLAIMVASWATCMLLYWMIIVSPGRSALYVLVARIGADKKRVAELPRVAGLKALRLAGLFSARNVVRLGFGQLDLGVWLRMLQRRDYDVVASGWLRTLAAAQALLSQYMIALSVLSAFGTPFDT